MGLVYIACKNNETNSKRVKEIRTMPYYILKSLLAKR